MNDITYGCGAPDDPWVLQTPSLGSTFEAWKDEGTDPASLVIQVGKTRVAYQLCALKDAHSMLLAFGDWMPLGTADEGKPTKAGTLEHWARCSSNPVGGYYGLRKGYRGRFANYVPPVMELLGLVELEHNARNNRLRALTAPTAFD